VDSDYTNIDIINRFRCDFIESNIQYNLHNIEIGDLDSCIYSAKKISDIEMLKIGIDDSYIYREASHIKRLLRKSIKNKDKIDDSFFRLETLSRYFPNFQIRQIREAVGDSTNHDIIFEAIDKYTTTIIDKINMANEQSKNIWLTENVGSQLTSSFNPVDITREKWYGKYYNQHQFAETDSQQ